MELIYAIAEYLQVPNEHIKINRVHQTIVWFSCRGVDYTCRTVRGKFLKKHSIRKDLS